MQASTATSRIDRSPTSVRIRARWATIVRMARSSHSSTDVRLGRTTLERIWKQRPTARLAMLVSSVTGSPTLLLMETAMKVMEHCQNFCNVPRFNSMILCRVLVHRRLSICHTPRWRHRSGVSGRSLLPVRHAHPHRLSARVVVEQHRVGARGRLLRVPGRLLLRQHWTHRTQRAVRCRVLLQSQLFPSQPARRRRDW